MSKQHANAIIKGVIYRRRNLPNSIKYIQKVLSNHSIDPSTQTSDGRTNSCIDEDRAIEIIKNDPLLKNRLKIPKTRHWFDIGVYDYHYGFLPINIKSTTTTTSDNTGNLATCVWALTDAELAFDKSYQNGPMSKILFNSLKNNKLNKCNKRDYYFVVINKNNTKDVIVNSFKGLYKITPNINNLPFQVKWNDNREFNYKSIKKVKEMVINAIINPRPSWSEVFLRDMRDEFGDIE